MRTIERDIVGAHIYSSDGKLLVAKGAAGGVYPGTWKIPGGGVDEGETKEQAMAREIEEETGIDVSDLPIELVDDDMVGEAQKSLRETGERVQVKMRFYTYKVVLKTSANETNISIDPEEFDEYRWVELAELKTLHLSPPSIELFTKLGFL